MLYFSFNAFDVPTLFNTLVSGSNANKLCLNDSEGIVFGNAKSEAQDSVVQRVLIV